MQNWGHTDICRVAFAPSATAPFQHINQHADGPLLITVPASRGESYQEPLLGLTEMLYF